MFYSLALAPFTGFEAEVVTRILCASWLKTGANAGQRMSRACFGACITSKLRLEENMFGCWVFVSNPLAMHNSLASRDGP